MVVNYISIKGARENNLKNVSIEIPKNQLVVVSGKSGSGKSSLVFDTLHVEGRRKYVESLPSYSRQFFGANAKSDVDHIVGLSPTISIDQKSTSKNSRSTVATATEIYDYLRALFAGIGVPISPATNLPIKQDSPATIIENIMSLPEGTKIRINAPVSVGVNENINEVLQNLQEKGFQRVKINDKLARLEEVGRLQLRKDYKVDIIIDRVVVKDSSRGRIVDSVELAMQESDGSVKIDIVELASKDDSFKMSNGVMVQAGKQLFFTERLSCPESGLVIPAIEPKIFSFNSPYGSCTACTGIGKEYNFKLGLVIDEDLTLYEGAIKPWHFLSQKHYKDVLTNLAEHYKFDLNVPYRELSSEVKDVIVNGSKGTKIKFKFNDGSSSVNVVEEEFKGLMADLKEKEAMADNDIAGFLHEYQDYTACSVCKGKRLREAITAIKVNSKDIAEVAAMNITDGLKWFQDLPNHLSQSQAKVAKLALVEIQKRLNFLIDVGLHYLTLSREFNTLSGGEAQRIRLASQIGSGLSGIIYILDEPSIGLHQSDNERLIASLKRLRDYGNSVIVVEHDEATIREADYLIDVGPGAGINGGEIIAKGTVAEVAKNLNSITGDYLSYRKVIKGNLATRKIGNMSSLILTNARSNNLKNVNLTIPLGKLVAVSGVSGGGKSTLIMDTLCRALMKKVHGHDIKPGLYDELKNHERIDKVIKIDQSPIGRTPRSNPATYTGMFSGIRDLFADLPSARLRGYKSSRFSFNVKGGRCENCRGDGAIKVSMHFLPDVYTECEVCRGAGYNKETLAIKYKEKSIHDVLDMTVDEAYGFFVEIPALRKKLSLLQKVGLGYLKLGQKATTLSGGEAQRIKLTKELSKKTADENLYILDEPTTGLHSADVDQLLTILQDLTDMGNTVLVIEHNIGVIKCADYVIDIGPKGGEGGGYIVAEGSPAEVAANKNSVTGKFLLEAMQEDIRHKEVVEKMTKKKK